MSELVSPIVYKRVEVLCYNKPEQILYDKYSNKLIVINKETNKIIVISKDGKNLLKEVPFNFSLNMTIYKITFNYELTYMMMLCDDDKKKHKLMIINLDANKNMNIIKGEFYNCLGFFFIEEQMFNFNNIGNNTNDSLINFVIVYLDQVNIYKISSKQGNKIELAQNIMVTKHKMYTHFVYSKEFMVLCAHKVYIVGNENKIGFEFFNLSNPKFYQKTSTLKLILDKNTNKVKTIKDRIKSKLKKGEINSNKEMMIIKKDDYSKSHFFLEKIYNTLYFIWLSYQDHLIHLYNVDNLDCIQREIDIQFEGELSTLQFVDNLILLHNIQHKKTVIYDVKKESKIDKKIFEHFPITSYDLLEENNKKNEYPLKFNIEYEDINNDDFVLTVSSSYNTIDFISMQSENNIKIYEKDIQIHKNIIEVKEDNKTVLYYIYFDPAIYIQSKHSLKNLLILSRRKNAKNLLNETLSYYLHMYSKNNKEKNIFNPNELRITELKKVIMYISELIVKSTIIFNEIAKFKQKTSQIQTSNNISPSEIIRPYNSLFPKKKYLITQDNIYYQIFSPLEKEPDVNPEILILFFSFLHQEFVNNKINIQFGFYSTIIKILLKLKHFYRIQMIFQSSSLGSNSYIAYFLIYNIALNTDNKTFTESERQFAYQLGMDMYKRLKKYNEIVFTLLNQDKIFEALMLIKKYKLDMKLLEKNYKKKIIDYCYRNNKLFN